MKCIQRIQASERFIANIRIAVNKASQEPDKKLDSRNGEVLSGCYRAAEESTKKLFCSLNFLHSIVLQPQVAPIGIMLPIGWYTCCCTFAITIRSYPHGNWGYNQSFSISFAPVMPNFCLLLLAIIWAKFYGRKSCQLANCHCNQWFS